LSHTKSNTLPILTPTNVTEDEKLAGRIQRVENGLPLISLGDGERPIQLTLQRLMELYKAPGLSVAVVDNFAIAWATGYGVSEAGTTAPVTARTLFQSVYHREHRERIRLEELCPAQTSPSRRRRRAPGCRTTEGDASRNYEKSIELNPDNRNAVEELKTLKEQK
jgi:hypothetical protein